MTNDKKREILEMLASKEISKEEAEKRIDEIEFHDEQGTFPDSKKSNSKILISFAFIFGVVSVLALAGFIYLVYFFPKYIRLWAEEGEQLTVLQMRLADASHICQNYALIIMPLLFLTIIVCGVFALIAVITRKQEVTIY